MWTLACVCSTQVQGHSLRAGGVFGYRTILGRTNLRLGNSQTCQLAGTYINQNVTKNCDSIIALNAILYTCSQRSDSLQTGISANRRLFARHYNIKQ